MGISSANSRCGVEYYNAAQFARQFGLMQLIPIPPYLSCNEDFIDRIIVPEKTLESIWNQFAKDEATFQLKPYLERQEESLRFGKWWAEHVNKYFAKDLDKVLAKVTPEVLEVDDVDLAKASKSKKKSSRSEGSSPSTSLKRKGIYKKNNLHSLLTTQIQAFVLFTRAISISGTPEVTKPEPEGILQKKRLKKLANKKQLAVCFDWFFLSLFYSVIQA